MGRRILILGAGVYQTPLIRQAKAQGHYVAVASWSGQDPGMALADDPWVVDTRDRLELCQRAVAGRIEAVLTTGTDVAVPSLGYLCDRLGLPGLSYRAARRSSNKILAQQVFAAQGIPSARHQRAGTLDQARQAMERIGLPVMVKAPDSSGSRGVVAVYKAEELREAFDQARQISKQDEILIEEYLSGVEFGAQAIVIGGRVALLFCHNDTVTPPPVSVPIGHSCPANLSAEVMAESFDVASRAVAALAIDCAVCNIDFMLTGQGVKILELGARAGATGIPEIIHAHFGIDLYAVALDLALGKTPRLDVRTGPAAAVSIVRAPAAGRLSRCRAPQALLDHPDVRSVSFDYPEGAVVRAFRTGPDRIGAILVTGRSASEAEAFAETVAGRLEIAVAADG